MTQETFEATVKGFVDLIEEKFKQNEESHQRIEAQVRNTNGRVRGLEKWRWAIGGALTVLSILVTILGGSVVANFK